MPWKAAAWLLIPLVGLLELAAHHHFSRRAPDIEEWRAVQSAVKALGGGEHLIVVAPHWAEPNARHAFGDAMMPLHHVARADMTTFERVIEVGILNARAPELEGFRVLEERSEGKFELRLLENPKVEKPRFSFIDHVPSAEVADHSAGSVEPCHYNPRARRSAGGLHGLPAFPAQRHVCSGPDWHFVGVTVVEDQTWKPRRCIWAHPVDDKVLTIAFSDVPLGKLIRGYATLPFWVEREQKGTPVSLEVLVNGTKVGTYQHDDGDGWKAFEFETGAAGTRARVEFRVQSERFKERQFCFTADTR